MRAQSLFLLSLLVVACSDVREEVTASSSSTLAPCAEASVDKFQFDDDACHVKKIPANKERSLSCPIVSTTAPGFSPSSGPMQLDPTALGAVVPAGMAVTVILVRRVNGVPVYHYMSNGAHDATFQPWSSTKFMAIAGAGAALREKSGGKVGLTSRAGGYPLGDLATIVASYDEQLFSSNGLSRWFLNVSGRARAQSLVSSWLGRPAGETYGGNYGVAAPAIPYTFVEGSGAQVSVIPDDQTGIANRLSTFTLAEALKRIAVWDDVATRLPGLTDDDARTLLYGAADSTLYPGKMGGLAADNAIYVQNALDIEKVATDSQGKFRIFGKLGFGSGEFVNVTYACLPVLDACGVPVPDEGAEFIVATQLPTSASASTWLASDRNLATIYERIIKERVLPKAQPNKGIVSPTGDLNDASCAGFTGWAQDPDSPDSKLEMHFYYDAPAGQSPYPASVARADQPRADLCGALGGSVPCDHAFIAPKPDFLPPGTHTVYAYAIDAEHRAENPLVGTRTFTCE